MKYIPVPPYDGNENKKNLESKDSNEIMMNLLSISMYGDDYEQACNSIKKFLVHENEYVRGCAIECIGHLARIWKKLPIELRDAVKEGYNDESTWVVGKSETANDDINSYIKK